MTKIPLALAALLGVLLTSPCPFQIEVVAQAPLVSPPRTQALLAQEPRVKLQLATTLAPGVTVEPYNEALSTAFASLLQRPGWGDTARYALVVLNRTPRSIPVLVYRYRLNQSGWLTGIYESYSKRRQTPAVMPHSATLVTPGGISREDLVLNNAKFLPYLGTVEVKVDSLIFDDGGIAGENSYGIERYLTERRVAAQRVIDQIVKTSDTIKDPKLAVSELLAVRPGPTASHLDIRTYAFAGMIREGASSVDDLTRYTNVPPLHRIGGQ